MNEAGGWNERTTVEDMDLAVRASMHGWKFVYLHDLEVTTCSMLHTTLLDCPDIINTHGSSSLMSPLMWKSYFCLSRSGLVT